MSLPKRLYYPLELAATRLLCTTSDLIHYGATSNVEICIHLGFQNANCFFEYNDSSELDNPFNNNKYYFKGKYNAFVLKKDGDDIYINDFYGLAALMPQDLLSFDLESESPITINQLFSPAGNGELFDKVTGAVYIEPDENQIQELTLDKILNRLFITDIELNRLMNLSESEEHPPSLPDVNRKTSSKTQNSQAKFIKSLLQIHYGADVANSPRQHLERKSSGSGLILADFESKGLKAPSGVVVDKWLKFIDVENIGDPD